MDPYLSYNGTNASQMRGVAQQVVTTTLLNAERIPDVVVPTFSRLATVWIFISAL